MSRSCIVHDFPLPNRQYYAAAPDLWEEPTISRSRRAAARSRRKNGRSLLPLLALAGLTFFTAGFLLGRAGAVGNTPSLSAESRAQQSSPLPAESDSIRVHAVTGAVISSGEEQAPPSKDDWNLLLVNKDHPLPQDFQVPEFTQLVNGHSIDKRAYPALQRMMDACRAEGLQPTICSSYRTWEKQEELFERKVRSCLSQAASREEAEVQAAFWVARPGTSEHQAGLAVDIVDKSHQTLDEGQEETAVQRWLMEHCAEYGFILRYPTDKSALTGVGYEPWHYRYVGESAAGEIMDRGICLEEYLEEYPKDA